jgi:hypothetical protein
MVHANAASVLWLGLRLGSKNGLTIRRNDLWPSVHMDLQVNDSCATIYGASGFVAKSQGGKMDINNIFTYHAPSAEQLPKYEAIRAKAKELGQVIVDNTPVSADQTAAIRLLREAVMTANAAIALNGKL